MKNDISWFSHSSYRNSSGMKNSGIWKSCCAPISLKLPWSCSRAPPLKKTFYVRLIQDDVLGFAPIGWICKRERYVGIYFLGLHESFSDIGAHLEFQKPKFIMPELLLKELWVKLTKFKRVDYIESCKYVKIFSTRISTYKNVHIF